MPASRALSQTVAAVDFGPIGGARALAELLPTEARWRTVTVDPLELPWRDTGPEQLGGHAAAGAATLIRSGTPGGLMIAQCSAAAYALQVHRQLSHAGAEPALLILVEPIVITPELVLAHVADLFGRLGAGGRVAEQAVHTVAGTLGHGPVADLLEHLMRDAARRNAPELGLDEIEAEIFVEQLVLRYVNWIGFLAGHLGNRPEAPTGPVHVLAVDPAAAIDRWCALLGADPGGWTPVAVDTPHAARAHLATLLTPGAGEGTAMVAG